MGDYLWDKEGQPDPDVGELEQLLQPLAYKGPPPHLPARRGRARAIWISAGVFAGAAILAMVLLRRPAEPPIAVEEFPSWPVSSLEATATCDGRPIGARLPAQSWLETGAGSASLRVADIGTVELGPHSRARILVTNSTQHRVELERGTLSAQITATPRVFAVETKHAIAFDLGCAFSLSIDASGEGKLIVTSGAVALSDRGAREITVDAGAECGIDARGPIAPYRSDASSAFRDALALYARDQQALPRVLAAARPVDRFTLQALAARAGVANLDVPPTPIIKEPIAKKTSAKETRHKHPTVKKAGGEVRTAAPITKPISKPVIAPGRQKLGHDPLENMDRSAQ